MQVIPGSQFSASVHVAILHQSVLQQHYFLLSQECRPQNSKKLKNVAYVARNSLFKNSDGRSFYKNKLRQYNSTLCLHVFVKQIRIKLGYVSFNLCKYDSEIQRK